MCFSHINIYYLWQNFVKVNVSKLEDYHSKHESQLTEQQKCEVESVVQRLLAISHK